MATGYDCLGPVAVEAELRRCVEDTGSAVFSLQVDDSSILLSMELVPGDSMSRHAHYVPYAPGCIARAVEDTREWIKRIVGRR